MRRLFSFEGLLGVLALATVCAEASPARADVCSISAVSPRHGMLAIGMVVIGAALLVVQRVRRTDAPRRPE
jgi:hypothetical protein